MLDVNGQRHLQTVKIPPFQPYGPINDNQPDPSVVCTSARTPTQDAHNPQNHQLLREKFVYLLREKFNATILICKRCKYYCTRCYHKFYKLENFLLMH
jgi:hypothetical protein